MRRFFELVAWLLAAFVTAGAASPPRSPVGDWLTEEKAGIVEVFRCQGGAALCGRLVWFRPRPDDPNPHGLDLNNPDPARHNQSLCGLTLMNGFKPAGPDSWEGGSIYDPNDGRTYRATMTLQGDGTLRLRGYIGVSLFGASEVWTKFVQPVPSCPTG